MTGSLPPSPVSGDDVNTNTNTCTDGPTDLPGRNDGDDMIIASASNMYKASWKFKYKPESRVSVPP